MNKDLNEIGSRQPNYLSQYDIVARELDEQGIAPLQVAEPIDEDWSSRYEFPYQPNREGGQYDCVKAGRKLSPSEQSS